MRPCSERTDFRTGRMHKSTRRTHLSNARSDPCAVRSYFCTEETHSIAGDTLHRDARDDVNTARTARLADETDLANAKSDVVPSECHVFLIKAPNFSTTAQRRSIDLHLLRAYLTQLRSNLDHRRSDFCSSPAASTSAPTRPITVPFRATNLPTRCARRTIAATSPRREAQALPVNATFSSVQLTNPTKRFSLLGTEIAPRKH